MHDLGGGDALCAAGITNVGWHISTHAEGDAQPLAPVAKWLWCQPRAEGRQFDPALLYLMGPVRMSLPGIPLAADGHRLRDSIHSMKWLP